LIHNQSTTSDRKDAIDHVNMKQELLEPIIENWPNLWLVRKIFTLIVTWLVGASFILEVLQFT